ncbi:MAG: hypothetical protein ACRDGT_04330 [Candidatus Limnocylindria bacterium]
MPIDLAHLLRRFADPFNTESRFYWPLVIAVFAAIVANIVWYYWRPQGEQPSPGEESIRPWAFWANVIFCIWYLVLLIAKVPFYWFAASFAVNIGTLVYLYAYWLPPQDAAWQRELRRLKYIPEGDRLVRRRRRRR